MRNTGATMAVSESIMARRTTLWADLAVLGVAVVWGASYPVAKGALEYMPVLVLLFYRFTLTALLMSAVAFRDLRAACPADLRAGALLGGILSAIFLAETWGVSMTTATNTALIISLCTILTPFLEFGLQRRLPPAGIMCGGVVAVIGVMVLSGGMGALGFGDLLVLCAAGLRAVMVVSTKRLMEGSRLSSAALTAVQAATVAGVILTLLLAQSGPQGLLVSADINGWASVAFLIPVLHRWRFLCAKHGGAAHQPHACRFSDGNRAVVRFRTCMGASVRTCHSGSALRCRADRCGHISRHCKWKAALSYEG